MRKIRRLAVVVPALLLAGVESLHYGVLEPMEHLGTHLFITFAMLVGVLIFSWYILRILEGMRSRQEQLYQEARAHRDQLRALQEAGLSLTADLDLETVLQKVVDLSREVIGACYGALAVLGEDGRIAQFVTSGLDRETVRRLGAPPEGRGVLGVVIKERKPLRLARVQDHPASVGFPPGHPLMKSFIGVPITYQGQILGNLYLTDKIGSPEFSVHDQETVERFAAQAAVAIANARLYAQVQRLAVLEERERIGMDLHDGTIQSLYAVGLTIDDVIEQMEEDPESARSRLDRVVEQINGIIGDIRHYIFKLRLPAGSGGLVESIENLVEVMNLRELMAVEIRVEGEEAEPSPERTAALWHICREALMNIVKHAQASRVTIDIRFTPELLQIRIADNGTGFDTGQEDRPERHGLRNMRSRAAALGARMQVESQPGRGTTIHLAMSLAEDEDEELVKEGMS